MRCDWEETGTFMPAESIPCEPRKTPREIITNHGLVFDRTQDIVLGEEEHRGITPLNGEFDSPVTSSRLLVVWGYYGAD